MRIQATLRRLRSSLREQTQSGQDGLGVAGDNEANALIKKGEAVLL